MKFEALIMLIGAQGVVTGFMCYFLYKVLTTPPNPEPDSFSENDDVVR